MPILKSWGTKWLTSCHQCSVQQLRVDTLHSFSDTCDRSQIRSTVWQSHNQASTSDEPAACMQMIGGVKGKRHRLVSLFNNMQSAESLKMQSVMLGGAADASAFMTDVGPFAYDSLRAQEAASPQQTMPRLQEMLPQLAVPQVRTCIWHVAAIHICLYLVLFSRGLACHL